MDASDLKLIQKASWVYANHFNMEIDEVKSMAYYVYVKAQQEYDSDKAKFSTFFYKCLKFEIMEYIRRNPLILPTEIDEHTSETNFERTIEFSSHIENTMKSFGKDICRLIFHDDEIIRYINKPKKMKGMIRKKLREQGWKWENIWEGFDDIESCLRKF